MRSGSVIAGNAPTPAAASRSTAAASCRAQHDQRQRGADRGRRHQPCRYACGHACVTTASSRSTARRRAADSALTQADGTALGNLTVACNEARDPDGGAGLAFDGSGSGPSVSRTASFLQSCRCARGRQQCSACRRPCPISICSKKPRSEPHDIDIVADTARTASPATVSIGRARPASTPAAAARRLRRSIRATRMPPPTATPDAGTVDRGYHYPDRYLPPATSASTSPWTRLIQPDTSLHVTLLRVWRTGWIRPQGHRHRSTPISSTSPRARMSIPSATAARRRSRIWHGIYVFAFAHAARDRRDDAVRRSRFRRHARAHAHRHREELRRRHRTVAAAAARAHPARRA